MWWGPLTNQKPPRPIDQSQLAGMEGHRGGAEGAWRGHGGVQRGHGAVADPGGAKGAMPPLGL